MDLIDFRLELGSADQVLDAYPEAFFSSCITSPPYWGVRIYDTEENQVGIEQTLKEYIQRLVLIFRKVRRVLRSDGTLWLNLGDSQIGTTKESSFGLRKKEIAGIPWRVAFALQEDGWFLRQDVVWNVVNKRPESSNDRPSRAHEYIFLLTKQARYFYDPDAVLEPYSPLTLRQQNQEYKGQAKKDYSKEKAEDPSDVKRRIIKSLETRVGRHRRSVWSIKNQPSEEGHPAVFPEELVELCLLAGTSERGVCSACGKPWEKKGKDFPPELKSLRVIHDRALFKKMLREANKRQVWESQCSCGAAPIGAPVLDPFCGSGTVGKVCLDYGRRFVGIDISKKYLEETRARLERTRFTFGR